MLYSLRDQGPAVQKRLRLAMDSLLKNLNADNIEALRRAVNETDALLEDVLHGNYGTTGCTCHTVSNDEYTRVIYDTDCKHYGHLRRKVDEIAEASQAYKKELDNAVRLQLITASMPALFMENIAPKAIVEKADAVLRELHNKGYEPKNKR